MVSSRWVVSVMITFAGITTSLSLELHCKNSSMLYTSFVGVDPPQVFKYVAGVGEAYVWSVEKRTWVANTTISAGSPCWPELTVDAKKPSCVTAMHSLENCIGQSPTPSSYVDLICTTPHGLYWKVTYKNYMGTGKNIVTFVYATDLTSAQIDYSKDSMDRIINRFYTKSSC